MGYADGYYYGQGRIICDTSTFSIGDTIRVRSMTDSSKVWNQQVATVGTALVFTVPCYDYYKICTVQEIDNVETEIGGVYKTVDFGQTLFINVLDKTTLGGIQGILNAHQETELLAIGDEVTIKVGGVDWVMQVGAINLYENHSVDFVSKYLWSTAVMTSANNQSYANPSGVKDTLQNFYTNISENDKVFLKEVTKPTLRSTATTLTYDTFTDKVYPPNKAEVDGNADGTPPLPIVQFPLFTTQANRIKTYNGSSALWWTCDGASNNAANFVVVTTTGNTQGGPRTNFYGVLPCFRLTADS